MKKLLLTLAAGIAFAPVFAQSANVSSVVFTDGPVQAKNKLEDNHPVKAIKTNVDQNGNKTTAGGSSWFDYAGIMASSQSQGYYNLVYQDSNIVYNTSSGLDTVWLHGMGVSFDPTDSAYIGSTVDPSAGPIQDPNVLPSIRVTNGNAYSIDSIAFPISYERNTNNDDSLFIDITKTTASGNFGVYDLSWNTPQTWAYDVTPDGKPRFGTAIFDPVTNKLSDSIPSANIVRIGYKLDAAMFADTNANGYLKLFLNGIALPSALNVEANQIVIVHVSFKSGVNYPFPTNLTSANAIKIYTFSPSGQTNYSPKQNMGSYQCGLMATRGNKYPSVHDLPINYDGHNVLSPSIIYVSDGFTSRFALHVQCPTCPALNVADFNSNIVLTNAYPNPANTEVRVPFSLKNAANVTVTLANTVGQVVKTQNMGNTTKGEAVINVSDLANGVYFYTVNADGQHKTGRIVVNN